MTETLSIKNLSDEKMYVAVPEEDWIKLNQRIDQLTAVLSGKGIIVDQPLPKGLLQKVNQGEMSPIEAVILDRGVKKVDLVKKAGVARSTLYRSFSKPDKTYASVYLRLAEVLDTTVDQLLTGKAVVIPKSSS